MCVFLSRSTSALEVTRNGLICLDEASATVFLTTKHWAAVKYIFLENGRAVVPGMHLKASRDISGCAVHYVC